jgi:hypothetical protein
MTSPSLDNSMIQFASLLNELASRVGCKSRSTSSKPENKSAAPFERRFGTLLLDAGGGESVEEGSVALGVVVGRTGRSL